MINMENIFGKPEDGYPIVKIGPSLIADYDKANIVEYLKPTIVNFANNHTGDFGPEVAVKSMEYFRNQGYIITGGGANIDEAYKPAYLEKDGVKVGIVGVCENEFGIARDNVAGSAGYDLGRLSRTIMDIKNNGALPIVFFHGGNEFNPFPTPTKVDLYRHFIDFGAKAVIAMHTHCPQAYEMYHDGAIVYSMGNLYFPRDLATYPSVAQESWFWGYLTQIDITNDKVAMDIIPYRFDSDYIEVLKDEKLEKFNGYMKELNAPLSDPKKLKRLFDAWTSYKGYTFLSRAYFTDDFKDKGPEEWKQLKSIFSVECHNEVAKNAVYLKFFEEMDDAGEYLDYVLKLQEMEY